MGIFKRLFGRSQAHYSLNCLHCDFAHHIPTVFHDADVTYSVNRDDVKMVCVYGPYTLSLEVKEFFKVEPAEATGLVLSASIGTNMRALHDHMLTHTDPLFLIVRQSPQETNHKYARLAPESRTPYVMYRKEHGVDLVGEINLSKAEIPGVTDRPKEVPEQALEYFQCERAHAELICSDNACPCGVPGAKIPVNAGYLIVLAAVVQFRTDARTVDEAKQRLRQLGITFQPGQVAPQLVCERSPLLKTYNRQVAKSDALRFWKDGMVPLRETPRARP